MLAAEVRRLRQELEREQRASQTLREALELAATYFQSPHPDGGEERAWRTIVSAIRSDAGRAVPGGAAPASRARFKESCRA